MFNDTRCIYNTLMENSDQSESQYKIVILLLILVFTVIQLVFAWNGGENKVFNSPDANANYHFAERIFKGEPLAKTLPFEASDFTDYLFTRSTRVVGSSIIPVGFVGLIVIYGFISKALFLNLISYLTIFFASVGSYYFFLTIKKVLNTRVAFLATILLLIHPAWWYYVNDSLLPNVLFVSLLMIATYYLFTLINNPQKRYYILFGFFLVLALFVRTSEILWIAPSLVIYLYLKRTKINWRLVWLSLGIFFLTTLLALLLQGYLTKGGLPIGYNVTAISIGFNPLRILRNFLNYGLLIFWPFSILLGLGLLSMFPKEWREWKIYLIVLAVISSIILVFYGSWLVVDHPDPKAVTIGTSYVRYFLPIYIFSLPIAAHAWLKYTAKFKRKFQRPLNTILIVGLVFFLYGSAFVGNREGILEKSVTLSGYDTIAGWVDENTPESSLIVTDKSDKYIWPNRLVMSPPTEEKDLAALAHFVSILHVPTYYMGLTVSESEYGLIKDRWNSQQLELGDLQFTHEDISVYPITSRNDT